MVSLNLLLFLATVLLAVADAAISPLKDKLFDITDAPVSPDIQDSQIVTDEEIEAFLQSVRSRIFTRVDTVRISPTSTSYAPYAPWHNVFRTPSYAYEPTASETRDESVNAVHRSHAKEVMTVLIIGVAAAGLLVIFLCVIILVVVCRRGREKKDMSLNKDLNRWDPQLLRPSKKDIDAFIFGTPIPTVTEMIKQ